MRPGERLPEHHTHGPGVGCECGRLAEQALGRDVPECARDVAHRRQGVELLHLGETEVEQAHVDLGRIGEKDVRRLDVAMHDSAPVRVCERFEHLGSDLDRRLVVELSGADRLAHRSAGDVLVRDVDVIGIPRERVDSLAARMPECRRGFRLSLRAGCGLALPRDDLEGDVEARLLVAREPDVSHPSGSERAQRAIAAEDQLALGSDGCHPPQYGTPAAFPLLRNPVDSTAQWNLETTTSSSISSTTNR